MLQDKLLFGVLMQKSARKVLGQGNSGNALAAVAELQPSKMASCGWGLLLAERGLAADSTSTAAPPLPPIPIPIPTPTRGTGTGTGIAFKPPRPDYFCGTRRPATRPRKVTMAIRAQTAANCTLFHSLCLLIQKSEPRFALYTDQNTHSALQPTTQQCSNSGSTCFHSLSTQMR